MTIRTVSLVIMVVTLPIYTMFALVLKRVRYQRTLDSAFVGLLLSAAVCDLLLIVTNIFATYVCPWELAYGNIDVGIRTWLYRIVSYLAYALGGSIFSHQCLIALNRFTAVVKPAQHKHLWKRHMWKAMILNWTPMLIWWVPTFLGEVNVQPYIDTDSILYRDVTIGLAPSIVDQVTPWAALFVFFCTVFTTVLYSITVYRIYSAKIESLTDSTVRSLKSSKRMTFIGICLIIPCILMTIMLIVATVIPVFAENYLWETWLLLSTVFICQNPYVIISFSSVIQLQCRKMLGCKSPTVQSAPQSAVDPTVQDHRV